MVNGQRFDVQVDLGGAVGSERQEVGEDRRRVRCLIGGYRSCLASLAKAPSVSSSRKPTTGAYGNARARTGVVIRSAYASRGDAQDVCTNRVYVESIMPLTISSLLERARDLPDHEATRLLLSAAERDRSWMLGDPEVSPEIASRFLDHLARRRSGEPLQYIEGTTQFGPVALHVDERALVPRPETELLWEMAVGLVAEIEAPIIVDLCTGSGNLALALKHSLPQSRVVGSDLSEHALELAIHNRDDLGLDVVFVPGDLFDALPTDLRHHVDLIVSNPPYVGDDEYRLLPDEITRYEPRDALVAGPEGLDVLRRIAARAADWLRPGGAMICEIGETQGGACMSIFAPYRPRIEKDLSIRDRFVLGYAPMERVVH